MIKHFSLNSKQRILTGTALIAVLITSILYLPPMCLSIAVLLCMHLMIQELQAMVQSRLQFFLLVPFYPIIPCLILIALHENINSKPLFTYLFAIVFTFDSASYLVGKIWNKLGTVHKIAPKISPGKSWQGAFGGYVITTILLQTIFLYQQKPFTWILPLVTLTISMIALAGDLFESYLKRSAGLKDSGNILPGHGGLLDRFDAILATSYFFFIFQKQLILFFS